MKRISLSILIIFILYGAVFPWQAGAATAQDLTTAIRLDFAPVRAEVTAAGPERVVISIPKGAVVRQGDLFSVFSSGRSSASAATGPSGKIQVEGLTGRSAQCRILEQQREFSAGDAAIRYEGLRAVLYLDEKPIPPRFSTGRLRSLLPYLDWLEPHEAIMPKMEPKSMRALRIDLLFRFKDGDLIIYGPDMEPIKRYARASSLLPPDLDLDQSAQGYQGPSAAEGSPARSPFLDLKDAEEIGRLDADPVKVAIADLDGDGGLEILYLLKDGLYISPFRRQGATARFKLDDFMVPYSFSLLPGQGLIALNVLLDGAGLSSSLLRYRDGRLSRIQGDINLWLSFVDTDCDGSADTLLGQAFVRERYRADRQFRIRPLDDGIEYLDAFEAPPGFNVNSNVQVVFPPQVGCSTVFLSVQGFLKVYGPAGTLDWSSLVPVVRQFEYFGTPDILMTPVTVKGSRLILYRGHPAGRDPEACWLCALASEGQGKFATFYALNGQVEGSRVCGIQMLKDRLIVAILRDESDHGDEPRYVTRLYSFDLSAASK